MGCETERGPQTWDPWGRYAQKDKKSKGSRGDGLWTARSGRATKPRRRPVSLDPRGRYTEKKKARNLGQDQKACWLQNQKVGRYRWTVGAGTTKNEKKNEPRGTDPLAAKLERGSITGSPWGQVRNIKQKEKGSSRIDKCARERARGR